ncbi:endonuclease V [bacterium]|nr:endonuclease V [bacterium]
MHSFDVSINEALEIQNMLRKLVVLDNVVDISGVSLVGGADVAFLKKPSGSSPYPVEVSEKSGGCGEESGGELPGEKIRTSELIALAGIVIIDTSGGNVVESVYAAVPTAFPYVPGFLSFREGPAVLAALGELNNRPGVMLYDGCGIAHPRGIGLASHMGVLTGIPSVGCAKSRLCGRCDEPLQGKGSWTEIVYHDEIVGICLRTRDNVKPVYVSPGNGFSIKGAREMVMSLVGKYRLPEPTRLAHQYVTDKKKELMCQGV